jgi:hypothetical protein
MERKTANIILGKAGESDRFKLKYGWFTFNLEIKPITAKMLIEISGEISEMDEVDENQELFPALMDNAADMKRIARVIAIATGTWFKRIVTLAVLNLPLKDMQTLFEIVYKQSDPTPFFFITARIGKMNLLTRSQEKQEEEKQSSEDSQ